MSEIPTPKPLGPRPEGELHPPVPRLLTLLAIEIVRRLKAEALSETIDRAPEEAPASDRPEQPARSRRKPLNR
jgi:hypothetical protein